MHRIAEYTDMFGDWIGTISTDSQSMLDTLFGRQNGTSAATTPSKVASIQPLIDPLIPEWDLPIEIRNSLQQLLEVQLVYIKGHQDQNKAYERLPLLAQLNVDADDMARRYRQEFGSANPNALMMPNTGVYVVYPEGTKTANYVADIRQRATSTPYGDVFNKNTDTMTGLWNSLIGGHMARQCASASNEGSTLQRWFMNVSQNWDV